MFKLCTFPARLRQLKISENNVRNAFIDQSVVHQNQDEYGDFRVLDLKKTKSKEQLANSQLCINNWLIPDYFKMAD